MGIVAATFILAGGALAAVARETILSPFEVNARRDGNVWKYVRLDDCEVLALCDDEIARQFVQAQLRGNRFLPAWLRGEPRNQPLQIVLWSGKRAPISPARKESYRTSGYNFGHSATGWFVSGVVTLSDRDSLVLAANLEDVSEYETVAVHYARASLADLSPPLPRWFREGFFGEHGIYPADVGIQAVIGLNSRATSRVIVPCLPWTGSAPQKEREGDVLLSWVDFFNPSSAGQISTTWSAQAGLFVHWGLLSGESGRAGAFWKFVQQAQHEPVSEATFERFFGFGFTVARDVLGRHLAKAVAAPTDVVAPGLEVDSLPRRKFLLRLATEAEVARLKGNFERLQAAKLRTDRPVDATAFEERARRTLLRGLRHAPEDSALWGLLGLLEYESGRAAQARPLLERAFAAGSANTRALVALAQLRIAEVVQENARLSAEQLAEVLEVLFAARERKPAVVEVYEGIAEAWERSAVAPKATHLAVLTEALALFPEDQALRARILELHRRARFSLDAEGIQERKAGNDRGDTDGKSGN